MDSKEIVYYLFSFIGLIFAMLVMLWVYRIFQGLWYLTFGSYFDKKQLERERFTYSDGGYSEASTATNYTATTAAAPTATATPSSTPEPEQPAKKSDFGVYTVTNRDGSQKKVFSEEAAKREMAWNGAQAYKGLGDMFEKKAENPFFENPFLPKK